MDAKKIVRKALENKLVVPAFNIPHLPMLKPIAQAKMCIRDRPMGSTPNQESM